MTTTTTSSSSVSTAAAAATSKPPHLLHITTTSNTHPVSPSSSITQSSSRSPRVGVGTGGGGGGGQNQACAACKYQRRKCSPGCPLARYFPADQQRRFLNAHRLFGVSNIQKTLRRTDPELRPDAMHALVFQAEARALDPVGGCFRIVLELEAQLHAANDELDSVLRYLALCRQQAATLVDPLADPEMPLAASAAPDQDDVVVDALYADQETADQAAVVQACGVQDHFVLKDEEQPPPHQLYDYFYYDGTAGHESSSHAWSNVDDVQQRYGNGDSGLKAGSPVALSEQLAQHCQIEAPFVDMFDMKQELPATMEHDGNADVDQQEEEVVAVAKNVDVDHKAPQMAESSAAAAHCQLELGFSSF